MTQENLPVTPVEVCSRAMVLVGLDPMSSFNETGRDEVIVASQLYEVVVADCMSSFPFSFCSGQQVLENDADPPLDRYETAWHLPSLPTGQPYFIETVRWNGTPIHYEIMGQRIYCNVDASEEVIAHYQYRLQEAYWPPQFTLMVIERLAERFAISVTRQSSQISAQGNAYEKQFARVKTRQSQQQTTTGLRPTRLTRFRRRGAGLPGNIA